MKSLWKVQRNTAAGPKARRHQLAAGCESPAILDDQVLNEGLDSNLERWTTETEPWPAMAPEAEADAQSSEDGLGVYLKQMGSIPLLDRQQELELGTRLDVTRRRYRRAAFWHWGVLARPWTPSSVSIPRNGPWIASLMWCRAWG
jgi:hypothetical protein